MSMTSPLDVVLGAQEPRLRSVPPAASSAGQEAIDLAASAGLYLDPWQQLVLREALGERPDGKWSAFEVALIVPRQCGKGAVLEALELFMLFLAADEDSPPSLILHSAHEFKTSAEHFRRMRDLVDGADHLRKLVRIVRTAAGAEAIELNSGARLRFVTRSGGSGRGFSADTIVIDEAYNLTPESMAAVLPTMSARPNPQVWYTSSAGMDVSEQLARLRERGTRGGDSRLAFFEWSAEDGADLDDPRAWAQANPALGIRIPLDFVAAERAALPDEQFARERLGVWTTKKQSETVLPLWDVLAAHVQRGSDLVWGVDVAEDRTGSIVVAWRTPAGVHGEMGAPGAVPSHRMVERVTELVRQHGGRVAAPSFLVEDLERAGLPVDEVKSSAWPAASSALVDAVAGATFSHGNQPELNAAAAAVRWGPTSSTGVRSLQLRDSPGAGPIFALTRALHVLTSAAQAPPNLW